MPRPKVADQILSALRREIVSGALPRDSRLPTERELAARFGVSSPTIREAIRGLSALGLVEVRHGSGAYVSPNVDNIVGVSLGTLVQLEAVGITDLIRLLRVLNGHAAELAVERGTDEDIAKVREAAELTITCRTVTETGSALTRFLTSFADAAHDPLLGAIVRFLVHLVVKLELSSYESESHEFWRRWASTAGSLRLAMVERLEARDADGLVKAVVEYHNVVDERIKTIPQLREARLSDTDFEAFIGYPAWS
jgi:DNA-binding FadR family transcriptional regulator